MKTAPAMIVILVAALAGQARAQDTARTRQLFESATMHYDLGEYAAALAEYVEAFKSTPDAAFLFNIAQCHRRLGHAPEAAQFYRTYLRKEPAAPDRALVEDLIAKMDAIATRQTQTASLPPIGTEPPAAPQPIVERALLPVASASMSVPAPSRLRLELPTSHVWSREAWGLGLTAAAGVVLAAGVGLTVHGGSLSGEAADAATVSARAHLLAQSSSYSVAGYATVAAAGALAVAALIRWIVFARR